MKKSQIGIEYLLTIGILLVVLMVIANISLKNSKDTSKIQQAQAAVDQVTSIATALNEMGVRSYKIAHIRFPSQSTLINTTSTFSISYKIFGSAKRIEKIIDFSILPLTLTALEGYQTLKFQKTSQDIITITKLS